MEIYRTSAALGNSTLIVGFTRNCAIGVAILELNCAIINISCVCIVQVHAHKIRCDEYLLVYRLDAKPPLLQLQYESDFQQTSVG